MPADVSSAIPAVLVRLGLLDAGRIADLAVANRQGHLADDGLSGELLAAMRETGFDAFRRPGMFGPELPAADEGPPYRRLLAFTGRAL